MLVDPADLTEVLRVEDEAHGRPGTTVQLSCFAGPGSGVPVADGVEIVEVAWLEPECWHLFAPAVRLALANLRHEPRRPDELGAPG